MTAPVSPTVRWTTVGAVLLVAAVAAVVSYAHMETVADRSGEGWRSYLLPLSVDGLMVAASMVLLTRRRAGLPGGALAWCALLAGVGASLAANVAAAEPTITARLVAAWPAVAFAVAFELLLEQRRQPAAEPARDPEPVVRAPVSNPASAAEPVRAESLVTVQAAPPARAPAPSPTPGGAGELAARARELAARNGGKPPGRRALAKQLGVTEHAARTVLDQLTPASAASSNGAAAPKDGAPR
ncbi:MAG: DUF2637 domain-containing protein [Pseudonocardiaceae bacterium]|nr:DUF2637 domain-containing protein [Pseudonocardiaceae bacterium]